MISSITAKLQARHRSLSIWKSVAGPFISQLAGIGNAILPKEEVEGWGETSGSHIVGTGAFTLEEIVTDEKVTLKKNRELLGHRAERRRY